MKILAGKNGLVKGQELTYFYPSTEWVMANSFTCLCGTSSCRGFITGARDMSKRQLKPYVINTQIKEMFRELTNDSESGSVAADWALEMSLPKDDDVKGQEDFTIDKEDPVEAIADIEEVLRTDLVQPKKTIVAATEALEALVVEAGETFDGEFGPAKRDDFGPRPMTPGIEGESHLRIHSRELSGDKGSLTPPITIPIRRPKSSGSLD